MAEILYFENPYKTEFEAKIVAKKELKEGLIGYYLDKTYFFAESGGQLSDKGYINEFEVIKLIKEENNILHCIRGELNIGDEVKCVIDKDTRLDYSIQHTAQHLLSAVLEDRYNAPTLSFHMSEEYSTIDIKIDKINSDVIYELENICNNIIFSAVEVKTFWISPDEMDRYKFRKIGKFVDKIRVVQIEGIDISMCAGTHVKRTNEIGYIKIKFFEKIKGGLIRLYFIAGNRVIRDYFEVNNIINYFRRVLSSTQKDLTERIDLFLNSRVQLEKELQKTQKMLIQEKLLHIEKDDKIYIDFTEGLDKKLLSFYAGEIIKIGKDLVLLYDKFYKILKIQQSNEQKFDIKNYFDEIKKEKNLKGGGNNITYLLDGIDVTPEEINLFLKNMVKN